QEAKLPKSTLEADREATDNEGYNPNDYDAVPVKDKNVNPANGKIYALLVGINDYANINKLSGCVNDVNKIQSYLQSIDDKKTDIKILTDAAATKKNIAQA